MSKTKSATKKKLVGGALGLAILLVGAVIAFKVANDSRTKDIGSRAAQTEVQIRGWEFDSNSPEGWTALSNTIAKARAKALRVSLRQRSSGAIQQKTSVRLGTGTKSIKFAALIQPFNDVSSTVSAGLCPSQTITCPNGRRQPAYTPQCRSNSCLPSASGNQPPQACPQDAKICPDGTVLQRMPGSCEFPECPLSAEPVQLKISYLVENKWYDQTVAVEKSNKYKEYVIRLPETNSILISEIRIALPSNAYGYLLSFDWIRVMFSPLPTTISRPQGNCVRSGCGGTLCVDEKQASRGYSVCVVTEKDKCYQGVKCERQKSGSCGWTQTPELTKCLGSITPVPQPTSAYNSECNPITAEGACNSRAHCTWSQAVGYCFGVLPEPTVDPRYQQYGGGGGRQPQQQPQQGGPQTQ